MYDFHISIFICIHYHWVYDEFTIDHLSMWLDSSVDKALQLLVIYTNNKVVVVVVIARSWVRDPFKPEFFSGCFSTARES